MVVVARRGCNFFIYFKIIYLLFCLICIDELFFFSVH